MSVPLSLLGRTTCQNKIEYRIWMGHEFGQRIMDYNHTGKGEFNGFLIGKQVSSINNHLASDKHFATRLITMTSTVNFIASPGFSNQASHLAECKIVSYFDTILFYEFCIHFEIYMSQIRLLSAPAI